MAKVFVNCKKCFTKFRREKREWICKKCREVSELDYLKQKVIDLKKKLKDRNPYRNRKLLIKRMGGCCIRCGFDDWRALQIDHVNGGGRKELKTIGKGNSKNYYISVLEDTSGKYQLLCANCNWIKRSENKEI